MTETKQDSWAAAKWCQKEEWSMKNVIPVCIETQAEQKIERKGVNNVYEDEVIP